MGEGDSLCPMTTTPECPALPCGQNCLYTVVSTTPDKITGEHRTPVARYIDDITFKFLDTEQGCSLKGKSSSRTWYAVLDYGTNYCNMRNLMDGARLSAEMVSRRPRVTQCAPSTLVEIVPDT